MKLDAPPPHSIILQAEFTEVPPHDDGERVELTKRARVSCTCGLDTGYIPTEEAKEAARQHVADYLPGVPFNLP